MYAEEYNRWAANCDAFSTALKSYAIQMLTSRERKVAIKEKIIFFCKLGFDWRDISDFGYN